MGMLTAKDLAFSEKKMIETKWLSKVLKITRQRIEKIEKRKFDSIERLWIKFINQSISVTNKQENDKKISRGISKISKNIRRKHWDDFIWTSNLKSRNQTKEEKEIYLWTHLSVNRKRVQDAERIYQYKCKERIHRIM